MARVKEGTLAAENPYLTARREWNERYGDFVKHAHQWRLVAVMSLGAVLLAVGGLAWIGTRNRLVPYVVEVDKLGAAAAVRQADAAQPADARIVRAQIARWVTCVRSVVADVAAERQLFMDAYAATEGHGRAYSALNEMFSARSPLERAQSETVSVEIQSVLPLAGATWRVEWIEVVRGRADGRVISSESWQATVTVAVSPPTDEATILRNPMGVYVTDYSWSKRL